MLIDDTWVANLVRDLVPFADPQASRDAIQIHQATEEAVCLHWFARGQRHTRTFKNNIDEVLVYAGDSLEGPSESFASFLASATMADVLRLASMTVAVLPEEYYLPSDARLIGDDHREALELFDTILSANEGVTNVVFVTANAGAGKSRTLRRLTRVRAELIRNGGHGPLFLYVDAQGRALARLDEAFAVALADLRSALHYTALPTLVRNGVLIPIIDGFDELLETSAIDAMSTLSRFLEELNGEGHMIACARSAFYESEFARRAQQTVSAKQSWGIQRVELLGWTEQQQRTFIKARLGETEGSAEGVLLKIRDIMGRIDTDSSGRAKPFFMDTLCGLLVDHQDIGPGSGVEILVEAYLSRELRDKLIDKERKPLMTREQLKQLLTAIAYEMWISETRALATSIVRELMGAVDVATHVDVRVRDAARLRGRFLACLQAPTESRIEFEHDLFFDYFMADEFAQRLRGQGDLGWLLACSSCTQSTADMICSQLAGMPIPNIAVRLGAIADAPARRVELVRENSGRILAAAIRSASHVERVTIAHVGFVDEDFRGVTFHGCRFESLMMRGCGLESAKFLACRFENVSLEAPRITRSATRLECDGLDLNLISGVDVVDGDGLTFRPDVIAIEFARCGARIPTAVHVASGVQESVLRLLERLTATMRSTNVIWPEDDQLSWLRRDPVWPTVLRELVAAGILESDSGPQRRQPRARYRGRIAMSDVLAGSTIEQQAGAQISSFWAAIRAAYPAA